MAHMTKTTTKGERVNYNGIDRVNDHLYVGGDPIYCRNLAADIDLLNERVDVIIDCRSEGERYDGWDVEPGVEVPVIYAPMHDDLKNHNSADDFLAAYMQLQELIGAEELPTNPVVFVHCHMGVNRGPSMALFLLMMEHNMTVKEAWELLHASREGMGIAYAGQALEAVLTFQGHPARAIVEGLQMWDQHERDWFDEPGRMTAVNRRIKFNRRGGHGAVVVDERGMAHGINKEDPFA